MCYYVVIFDYKLAEYRRPLSFLQDNVHTRLWQSRNTRELYDIKIDTCVNINSFLFKHLSDMPT